MVEVEVSVDDDGDLFRANTGFGQALQQLLLHAVDVLHFFRQLVARARLDQDGVLARAHQQRIQASGDAVHFVGRKLSLPQHLRHYAKEAAAVEVAGAVTNVGDFDVAQRDPLHFQTLFHHKGHEGSQRPRFNFLRVTS